MLHIDNQEHYDRVKTFAQETGCWDQLKAELEYLDTYADPEKQGVTKCVLGYDFAPHSFGFCMLRKDANGEVQPWFSGGLIYHADDNRWRVHT